MLWLNVALIGGTYVTLRELKRRWDWKRVSARMPHPAFLTLTTVAEVERWNAEHVSGRDHSAVKWTTSTSASDAPEFKKSRFPLGRGDVLEAGIIAALGSIPSFYYLSQIDPHVVDALHQAFATDMSNFDNLFDYIKEKYFDAVSPESADGWLHHLEGYVTEQYAADVLTRLGHHVEFPDASNNPGWDLMVDGHPIQIKGGFDYSKILDHFDHYPDIPVVTSDELANQVADKLPENAQVWGLDGLDPQSIHDATISTLDATEHLYDGLGHAIPVLTLVRSSIRELTLLFKDKTDIGTACKNVLLDVAGTGLGGLTGAATTGALLGAVAGPPGMAIGGLIGAVVGAIGGRMLTNHIKTEPFREAYQCYVEQVERSQKRWAEEYEQERVQVEQSLRSINDRLNIKQQELTSSYKKLIGSLWERQKRVVSCTPDVLRSIQRELKAAEQQMFKDYRPGHRLRRLLFPMQKDIFYPRMRAWFADRRRVLEEALVRFSDIPTDQHEIQARYEAIAVFFRNNPAHHPKLHESFLAVAEITTAYPKRRDETRAALFAAIHEAEQAVRKRVHQAATRLHNVAEQEKERIKQCLEVIRREADKLDITIPGLNDATQT